MDTLTASNAKREFGELLLKAQQSPIGINKNGKPVAVVISATEYDQIQLMKQQYLNTAIAEGLDDISNGRLHSGKTVFDELRKTI